MNKCMIIIAAMVLCILANGFDIVKDNKALATIYVSSFDNNTPLANLTQVKFSKLSYDEQHALIFNFAIKDLIYHLEVMSKVTLPLKVVKDVLEIKPPAIVIGNLAKELGGKLTKNSELKESFSLTVNKDYILIAGESPAGSAYGVYELLERLGCDWTMPGKAGEIIPELYNISIEKQYTEQSPSFEVRFPWYSGGPTIITPDEFQDFAIWKLRHKLQIADNWHPLWMKGGHVWDHILKINQKIFESDPEMLALVRQVNGSLKRTGPQLETANPKVVKLFVKYIDDLFEKNKWPNDKKVCIGVGPADGEGFSISSESMAIGSGRFDPINGSMDVTDIQVLLCNQILETIGNKYPNLYLGFYLYSCHADYPLRYKPHSKVLISIADISYSRMHGLGDLSSKTRGYYHDVLEKWSKLSHEQGNQFLFRGYNWNLADNILPYTKLKIWGEDIPYYYKIGVKGILNEYVKAWAVNGPSDYLEAKLTWNVNSDWQKVLHNYCSNAFGAGGKYLEEYYLKLAKMQSQSGREAGGYFAFPQIYDADFIRVAIELFEKATSAAKSDADKKRIEYASIPIKTYQMFLEFRNAYCSYNFVTAQQKMGLIKQHLRHYSTINSNLICRQSLKFLDRFFKKFIDEGVTYSTGSNSIIYRFPDKLKTQLDYYSSGEIQKFYRNEINDIDFILTSTYLNTWDAQGLGAYKGAVWYRVEFPVAAENNGKAIGLLLGGVDSVTKVWCNGQYLGLKQGYAIPHIYDLTPYIKFGQPNKLAIQVIRPSVSEINIGGIIYPSFVFAGNVINTSEEKVKKLLPGGVESN